MHHPRIGNCLLGAVWLRLTQGGQLKSIRPSCGGRHWFVHPPNNERWHFKLSEELLPWPLQHWAFVGRFERLGERRAK